MPKATPETQWTMNYTPGAIGMKHAKHRKRAVVIGEKIGLYADWPKQEGLRQPVCPGVG